MELVRDESPNPSASSSVADGTPDTDRGPPDQSVTAGERRDAPFPPRPRTGSVGIRRPRHVRRAKSGDRREGHHVPGDAARATPGSLQLLLPGTVDAPQERLRDQPLMGAGQLTLDRDVVQAARTVGQCSTTPADRHPPVCLWSVVLIELGAYLGYFGRDHDPPIARRPDRGSRRAGRTSTGPR